MLPPTFMVIIIFQHIFLYIQVICLPALVQFNSQRSLTIYDYCFASVLAPTPRHIFVLSTIWSSNMVLSLDNIPPQFGWQSMYIHCISPHNGLWALDYIYTYTDCCDPYSFRFASRNGANNSHTSRHTQNTQLPNSPKVHRIANTLYILFMMTSSARTL